MKSQLRVLYVLTSPLSVNTFGIAQLKVLHEDGFSVHLICGRGDLNSELSKFTDSIQVSSFLRRGFSFIIDLFALLNLFLMVLRVKPTIIIYSTPKSAFLSALVSALCRTPIRIYQVWGVRWQNLSGIKLSIPINSKHVGATSAKIPFSRLLILPSSLIIIILWIML